MVGEQMKKRKTREKAVAWLNLGLTEELDKRLNAYCVKKVQKNGKIPHGLRTKIARHALKEWLDRHENDLTLEL